MARKKTIKKKSQSSVGKASRYEMAAEIAQRVEIRDFHLVGSESALRHTGSPPPAHIRISHAAEPVMHDQTQVVARVAFRLKAHDDPSDFDNERFERGVLIEAVYQLAYDFKPMRNKKYGEQYFQAFAEYNAVHNAWPFWREFVHGMLGRMGLPAVVMPSFKLD